MIRLSLPCLMLLAAPALAQPMISLPLAPGASLTSLSYRCPDDRLIAVTYITAGDDGLALVGLDDQPRIFVNVIAASGARYVAGPWEWWTKGAEATLSNAMEQSAVTCRTQD